MTDRTPILIVDSDTVAAAALAQTLTDHGYACARAHSLNQAAAALNASEVSGQGAIGVVIVEQDVAGPGGGLELIQQLRQGRPALVPIVISGFRKVESAVRAMHCGAADYLLKPVIERELLDAVTRAVQRHVLLADDSQTGESAGAESGDDAADTAHHDNAGRDQAEDAQDVDDAAAWTPMPLAEAMKGPERRILLAALKANGWNRQETARQLDINRTTLYKKIRQYRLDEPAA